MYQTLTPSPVFTVDLAQLEPTGVPTASPTPFIYKVVANDTLIGIATRYNIALEELIAANPGIDPSFLIIGAELLIPAGDGAVIDILPTPTPVGISVQQPICYPTAAGGLWCLLLVNNNQAFAVENLAAEILLLTSTGEVVAQQQAIPLINVLPNGRSLPLVALFDDAPSTWDKAEARLLSAISVPEGDERYLNAEILNLQISIDSSGSSATITGEIVLAPEIPVANLIWILAIAYDENGVPVAVRRWDHAGELVGGDTLSFAIDLYSLGPVITQVELLYEVRP